MTKRIANIIEMPTMTAFFRLFLSFSSLSFESLPAREKPLKGK
ncbi:MAG TPA: hypothetical protein PLK35_03325 [Candidatus Moranbacteria bacterium]|nr:hypothetical protein [Candidatus Moranbacteria bacterium]